MRHCNLENCIPRDKQESANIKHKTIENTWLNSINYLYTLLYKRVLNKVLIDWRESQHLISRGNEFHRVGAATENARSPSVEEVLGTASKCLSEERRTRTGWYGTRRFDIYDGASPFNAKFHVNRSSLKLILSRTGSQCKSCISMYYIMAT